MRKNMPYYIHADASSEGQVLNFDLSLHLHPYFGYVSREGSDESAHLRRLIWTFSAHQYDKHQTANVEVSLDIHSLINTFVICFSINLLLTG